MLCVAFKRKTFKANIIMILLTFSFIIKNILSGNVMS